MPDRGQGSLLFVLRSRWHSRSGNAGRCRQGRRRTVKGASPSSRAEWERYFANDLPAEFVVKPTLGAHGKGFRLYCRDAADFSAPVLYDHLTKSTEWDNFVIQRRIRSHSDIVQLTGSEALQTARIITWVTPQGDIDVYLTFFRIVVGANFYDNYNYGLSANLIANIDPCFRPSHHGNRGIAERHRL